jgi:hypothetical protein
MEEKGMEGGKNKWRGAKVMAKLEDKENDDNNKLKR